MLTEKKVEALMAEVILDVVKDPANDSSAKVFCAENCLDRHRLTSKAIFSMQNATLFRIMMGIAQLASLKDYLTMCIRMALITYFVAKMEDGSPEAIRKAHAGLLKTDDIHPPKSVISVHFFCLTCLMALQI